MLLMVLTVNGARFADADKHQINSDKSNEEFKTDGFESESCVVVLSFLYCSTEKCSTRVREFDDSIGNPITRNTDGFTV